MRKTLVVVFVVMLFAGEAFSDQAKTVELEPIVVTPSRFEESIEGITGTFSVVENEAIEETIGDSIVDVLRKQKGIDIKEWYGTGIKATVDIRGFGETAPMNTLVLVDGRRINSNDLSGVDWYQISKESVERIEILRGSGAVLYGDNAAGGVINIITKKSKKPFGFKFIQKVGSYAAFTSDVQAEASKGNFSIFMNAKREETNGYRQNSYVKGTDLMGNLRYEITDIFKCDLNAHYNEVRFGLPGALSEADLEVRSRKESKFLNDQVSQEDWHLMLEPQINVMDNLTLISGFSVRDRSSVNDWGSSGTDTGKTGIKTYSATPRILYVYKDKYKLIAGYDFYKDDNETNDYARVTGILNATADIDKKSRGYYAKVELEPVNNLFLGGGYRQEEAIYDFDYVDNQGWYTDVDDSKRLDANAINAGISYKFPGENKLYANFNKSFRLPATDEFLLYDWSTWPAGRNINTSLAAQKSYSYDIGLKLAYKDTAKLYVSSFWMDTKNEIYYDPYLSYNNNYDDNTNRKGIEAQLKFNPIEPVNIYTNYTYTIAKFKGDNFSNNEIPAVPTHNFGSGADYKIGNFLFDANCRYVGKSRFISDQENRKDFAKGYFTVDAGCSFKYKQINIFGKVNNLFDRKYSEYNVRSSMSDTKNYYPSPERNYIFGASFEF